MLQEEVLKLNVFGLDDERCGQLEVEITDCVLDHLSSGSTPTNMINDILNRYEGQEKLYAAYEIGFLMGYTEHFVEGTGI